VSEEAGFDEVTSSEVVSDERQEAPTPEMAEEAALVVRIQRGDREAFSLLARRYAKPAFGTAFRILRQREDAEDLVQEAFMAALAAIATFDASRPFAPWFYRIVTNRGLNAAKSRTVRERYVKPTDLTEHDAPAEGTATGADEAERAEVRERFREALEALSERERLIVQMSDVDGRSSTEIGEMLETPSGTVRWHLHQARGKLRRALEALRREDA
jgi:RNA polymerase sigma-70 factor (ECF subfamily)